MDRPVLPGHRATGDHLAVVGGGIAGLAAAWEAVERGWSVTVVDGAGRTGGKLVTTDFLGRPVDEGADAFLRRVPDALRLCEELGITDLRSPAAAAAMVWADGRLHPFPPGSVMGVPVDPAALDGCDLVSAEGRARWAAEPKLEGLPIDHDVAVAPFLRERLGPEIADRLVAPLLGGIAAGDPERMSLDATVPQFAAAARSGPSLLQALRDTPRLAGPVFAAPAGGMQSLPDTLTAALLRRGVTIRTGAAAVGLEPSWTVHLADGSSVEADRVVVATPATASARLLDAVSAEVRSMLASLDHASAVLVTLGYRSADVELDPASSGFLVPRDAGLTVAAVSWGSSKWPHWADDDHHVLRVSAGHRNDPGPVELPDDELLAAFAADLHRTMGVDTEPVASRITRYPGGFVQHDVGHLERMDLLDRAVAALPGLALCGGGLRGVGIPASIASGRRAAAALCEGGAS